MASLKPSSLVRAAVLWYTAAVIAAQSVTPSCYSWLERTVSALGAQGYSNGWMMRAGMVGYGLLLSAGLSRRVAQQGKPQGPDLVLMLHAFLMTMAGFISTTPFVPGIEYSATQAYWHWNFAMGAGASVGVSMGWHLLTEANPRRRRVHLVAAVLMATFSAGFGLASARTIAVAPGLVQRLLHAVGLVWLWVAYGDASQPADSRASTHDQRVCARCGRPLEPIRAKYCTRCLTEMELRGVIPLGDLAALRPRLRPLSIAILALAVVDAVATIYGYQWGFITEANPLLERLLLRSPLLMFGYIVLTTWLSLLVLRWAVLRRPDLGWVMGLVLGIRVLVVLLHIVWIMQVAMRLAGWA